MIRDVQETLSRLVSVFRRKKLDQDFEEEFAGHIDLLTEQNERRGLSRDEARRRAILKMGGVNATKDLHREARGLPPLERFLDRVKDLGRDVTHAARSLARARGFTFVCVASLGVGIGTVIAMTLLTRVWTGPPSNVNSNGLVELLVTTQGPLRARTGREALERWSYPDFDELRNADTGMTISGWAMGDSAVRLPGKRGAARVPTMFVSRNYFRIVGASLARGRGFDETVDDASTFEPVVILAHEFWEEQLDSDPGIVGRKITLNGVPHTVVGIGPDPFEGHFWELGAQLWIPLDQHPRLQADAGPRFNRDFDWVRIVGRLSSGVDIRQANAAVSAIVSGLAARYPVSNQFKGGSVHPYFATGARQRSVMRQIQSMMVGSAVIALLIVCLNVSGMMLARSAMRERELSIRQAVGGSRLRLTQYLLLEALILAGVGGAISAFVLLSIGPVAGWWMGWSIPNALRPDAVNIAVSVGLCLGTSLLFGLLPAIRFSRINLISTLKDDVGGGRRVGRLHRAAAALQIAVAVPFLVFSGTLLDRARTTAMVDFGFAPQPLTAAQLDFAAAEYTNERADLLLRTIRDNLEHTSGIASVTVANGLPLDFKYRMARVSRQDERSFLNVQVTSVGEGYFDTLGIPLLQGRSFTTDDREGVELVTVISKPVAARLFPNGDAIGKRLIVAEPEENVRTVVGVTADFVTSQVDTEREQILLPLAQHRASSVYLIARSSTAALMTSVVEKAVHAVDPEFTSIRIVTGKELVERSERDYIAQAAVAGAAGTVALLLAALGVCGVIGFMVATRRREIAVRIALGAAPRRVLRTVLTDVLKLVAPGVAVGFLVAAVVLRTGLIEVRPGGLVAYVFGAAVAVLVALAAALPPARRAASIDPMVAMRSE
jgi:predicted permease